MPTTTKTLYRGTPIFGSTSVKAYVSNKALTSNLATLTTNAVHGITQVGTVATIQGVDSTFDGTYSIHSIPSTTTFTYVKAASNVTSVAVSPVGIVTFNSGMNNGFTVSNKVVQNNIATLTTSSAHNLSVGDIVAITIGDNIYDSTQAQVIAVPSSTTFSYIVSTTTSASTSVTQGSYGRLPILYTVPTSTTTIVTNISVTNTSNSTAGFTLNIGSVNLATNVNVGNNDSTVIDLKQILTAGQTITGSCASSSLNLHIAGVEIS